MASTPQNSGNQTLYFASIAYRFLALLIDGLCLGFFLFFVNMVGSGFSAINLNANSSVFLLVPFLTLITPLLYYSFLIGERGQTLGMMLLGIKVVDHYGHVPGVGKGIVRYFGSLISTLFFLVGFLWAFFNPQRQTWHDLMAGTYVVNA